MKPQTFLLILLVVAMLAAIGVNMAHILDLRHINAEEAEAWENLENASWVMLVNDTDNDYGWLAWYTDKEPKEVINAWGTRHLAFGHHGAIQWHTGYPIWFERDGSWIMLDGNCTVIVLPVHGDVGDMRVYK